MSIYEKINKVIKNKVYNFCGINFDVYKDDLIKIYNRGIVDCIFSCRVIDFLNIPDNLGNQTPIKEEFRKLDTIDNKKTQYAICFYLGDKVEKVEKPISTKITYR